MMEDGCSKPQEYFKNSLLLSSPFMYCKALYYSSHPGKQLFVPYTLLIIDHTLHNNAYLTTNCFEEYLTELVNHSKKV